MSASDILNEFFPLIQEGEILGDGAAVMPFPSDNGNVIYNAFQMISKNVNGSGIKCWVSAIVSGGAPVSSGAIMTAAAMPEFVALAVPCLGIAVGTIWYNMAPEFWDGVASQLVDAGYTIKGKVVGFITDEGNMAFPEGALQILSNALIDAGVFIPGETVLPEAQQTELFYPNQYEHVNIESGLAQQQTWHTHNYYGEYDLSLSFTNRTGSRPINTGFIVKPSTGDSVYMLTPVAFSKAPFTVDYKIGSSTYSLTPHAVTRNEITYYVDAASYGWGADALLSVPSRAFVTDHDNDDAAWDLAYITYNGIRNDGKEEVLQQDALFPYLGKLLSDIFPNWKTITLPTLPEIARKLMEVAFPDTLPMDALGYQDIAQNPGISITDDPAAVLEAILNPALTIELDTPIVIPAVIDVDVPALPEIIIPPISGTTYPDPIDPDPPIPPSPIIPVVPMPATVSSSRMFTVYNPNAAQIASLGAYLWDANLIDILKKIWQNPLDGIIGLSQIYCAPDVGGESNIILGYLNSNVRSYVVSNQFKTINCGTIQLNELNQNITDYAPYSALYIYLPFIGITELDISDFMGGSINVTYHVDVYTGSCLAEVKMIRARDLPNGGVVYTFNGNCSQDLPLTSGDKKSMLTALISACGVGLGIASGGATIAADAGAQAINAHNLAAGASIAHEAGRDVSREMLHVSRSGNLSANAGIMGHKKPYIIINRQKPYNANNYNKMYGYPANKSVYIGNCSGYVKLKIGRIKSRATAAEKDEIYNLLLGGVIMP